MALHPQRQGTDAAQRQEAAERVKHAAYRILQIAKLFREPGVIANHRQAGDDIGMAVEVLGRGVHHNIKPMLQRAMDRRRSKGVIGDADQVMAARDGGDGAEIRELQQRVGGRFHPDHARIGADRRFNSRQVVGFHPAHLQTSATAANVFQQAVSAAIHIIDRHQMTVLIQQLQHGGDGGQPGGERVAARAVFQVGDRRLQRVAGRVPATGIFIAGMLPRRRLSKSGGGVNRRHHCAVVVGEGSAMYAQGVDR